MSYDLCFAVKVENGIYIDFEHHEYDHPTYNLGNMFREATGWNFEQSKYYRVTEVLPSVIRGIEELVLNPHKYDEYKPHNGFGTLRGEIKCLQSIVDKCGEIQEKVPLEYVYISW